MDYIYGLSIINVCSHDVPIVPSLLKKWEHYLKNCSPYRIDMRVFYRLNCSHHFSNFSIFKTSKLNFVSLIIWGVSFHLINMTIIDVHIIEGKINLNKLPNFFEKVSPTTPICPKRLFFCLTFTIYKWTKKQCFFKNPKQVIISHRHFDPCKMGTISLRMFPQKMTFVLNFNSKGNKKSCQKLTPLMTLLWPWKNVPLLFPLSQILRTNSLRNGNKSTQRNLIWGLTKKSLNKTLLFS